MLFNFLCFLLGAFQLSIEVFALQLRPRTGLPNLASNPTVPVQLLDNTTTATPAELPEVSGNRSVGTPHVLCDGTRYHSNLRSGSCLDALSQIPNNAAELRFSPRSLSGKYDVGLPARWISRDGVCILDIVLKQPSSSAVGSYEALQQAANHLLALCVKPGAQGGVAMNLGSSKELGLVISSYNPNVECGDERAAPADSCRAIGERMPASQNDKWFGLANDRLGRPDIKLPRVLREISARCFFSIDTVGPTDRSSWFEMWEAVQAINGMCGRFGKIGRAFKRGVHGDLFVTMGDEYPQQALEAIQK